MLYGERSGGVRTYLDEKARYAARTGAFEHHVIVPGPRERHRGGRHELRAVRLVSSNGYRVPFGSATLKQTLRDVRPDVILLHDPFWRPQGIAAESRRLGARIVGVHHASAAMNAAGVPGPAELYLPIFRRVYRHAYDQVDAVMSVVDSAVDSGRAATIPLRLGVHPAFRPRPAVRREHVLYAGRLGWEKGVFELLEAAAATTDPWALWLVGDGPARRAVQAKAARLGIAARVVFRPFVASRDALARLYREASCVVMPGAYETFGLVALEAAASGARVVACEAAPSARLLGEIAEVFPPGDAPRLAAAIERARRRAPDVAAAAQLAERLGWDRVFEAELCDLERLVARGSPERRRSSDRRHQRRAA